MTTNPTRGHTYTIAQIVTMAYRRAGLLNDYQELDEVRAGIGRDELQLVLDELQTRGITARGSTMYELTLVAGQHIYTLAEAHIEPTGTASYIPAGTPDKTQAQQETPIEHISQESYQTLTGKDAQSRPVMYWPRRDVSPVQVYFWPVPEEAGTVRFQMIQLKAASTNGSYSADLETYWTQAIVYTLAGHLSINNSMIDKGDSLLGKGERYIELCMGISRDNAGFDMILQHRTQWNR